MINKKSKQKYADISAFEPKLPAYFVLFIFST